MKSKLKKSAMKLYLNQWQFIKRVKAESLLKTSPLQKLKQFFTLMTSTPLFTKSNSQTRQVQVVQKHWEILRKHYLSVQ